MKKTDGRGPDSFMRLLGSTVTETPDRGGDGKPQILIPCAKVIHFEARNRVGATPDYQADGTPGWSRSDPVSDRL
jgi:hypothetical protein